MVITIATLVPRDVMVQDDAEAKPIRRTSTILGLQNTSGVMLGSMMPSRANAPMEYATRK